MIFFIQNICILKHSRQKSGNDEKEGRDVSREYGMHEWSKSNDKEK